MNKEWLEITTKVGCPVKCAKYCPQEVTVRQYQDEKKTLSFYDYRTILSHIPKGLTIGFCGFCEPFINKDAMDMIALAAGGGHSIRLNTTLLGASMADVLRMIKIKYDVFCLHLPDGKNAKITVNWEYKDKVFVVLQNVPNVEFSIMNELFYTTGREDVCRNASSKGRSVLFRRCQDWNNPKFVAMPNGDVYLCCMDFALENKMGNLLKETYDDIKKRYKPPYSRCGRCHMALPLPVYAGERLMQWYRAHRREVTG